MLNSPISASDDDGDVRREAAVGQERRQVHADEHDLEAAHEEADRQQHVAAVAERLAHRLAGRLLESVRAEPLAVLDHAERERDHQEADRRHRQERAVPADVRQQPLRERQHRELAERARPRPRCRAPCCASPAGSGGR